MRNEMNRLKKRLLALGFASLLAVTGAAGAQETSSTFGWNPDDLPGPWGTCYGATMYHYKDKCNAWGRVDDFGNLPWEDPSFCLSECRKCCDEFAGMDDWEQELLQGACQCLVDAGFEAAEGGEEGEGGALDAFACVAPNLLGNALSMGLLNQEEYAAWTSDPLLLAHLRETADQIFGASIDEGFVNNWLAGLPSPLAAQLGAANATKLLRGLARVVFDSIGLCDELPGLVDGLFKLACEESCGTWFYKPSQPATQPGPSGGGGIEVQNNVVPEPDGSGGGWGDIVPDGTVTWVDNYGNTGPPPLQ